jgi:hypothetical protein
MILISILVSITCGIFAIYQGLKIIVDSLPVLLIESVSFLNQILIKADKDFLQSYIESLSLILTPSLSLLLTFAIKKYIKNRVFVYILNTVILLVVSILLELAFA